MANAERKKKIWNQKYEIPAENVNFMTEVIVDFERDDEPSQYSRRVGANLALCLNCAKLWIDRLPNYNDAINNASNLVLSFALT